MKVEVVPAPPESAELITQLMEQYVAEFVEAYGSQVEVRVPMDLAGLRAYFWTPGRHPFLVTVDELLAGFALVVERGLLSAGDPGHVVGEFFLAPGHRRRGVGEAAARALFRQFPGIWEVAWHGANSVAALFWTAVIGRYLAAPAEVHPCAWDEAGLSIVFAASSPLPMVS